MPLDPIALKIRVPEPGPGPLEMYGKALSLKEMIDQRQRNQELYAHQQQQRQWQEEDRTRMMSLREMLANNPKAGFSEIAPYDIKTAIDITKHQADVTKEQRLAEEADARRKEVLQKIRDADWVQKANQAMAIYGIKDPAKRQAAFSAATPAMVALGIVSAEEAAEPLGDDNLLLTIARRGHGSKVVEDVLKAQSDAARAAAKEPFDMRTWAAEATEKERKAQGEDSDFARDFYPGYLAMNRLEDNPTNRMNARKEWEIMKRPQFATPGVDEPLPAAVEAQRIRMQQGGQGGGIAVADLTPQSLDMMSDLFARTGQMPPLGQGKDASTIRRQIINRAAERNPSVDLAGNRADYTANAQSLTALQKSRDAIGAFEDTAKKNIGIFLEQAKKVTDSGSPWLNRPLRMVTRQAVGSENYLAFEAARRVAVNEIAKITSNPNLTGQMSDSARHEVESFIPQDATFNEVKRVISILTQDMDNRKHSLDDQIGAIRQRISPRSAQGGGTAPAQAPAKKKRVWNEVSGTFEEK